MFGKFNTLTFCEDIWELAFPNVRTSEQSEPRKCDQTMVGRRLNYAEAAERQTVTPRTL